VTQNKPAGLVALAAQMQQIFGQALRRIELAAEPEIATLPPGDVQELRGGTELFPQLAGAGESFGRFTGGVAFDDHQAGPQLTAKFELLQLTPGRGRQQRQLIQSLLELRRCFRHRRAGGGPPTGADPPVDGFFSEAGLGVVPREELGMSVRDLRVIGLERLGDLRVQLLAGAAQQAAMRSVLHQRVLEAVDRLGRRTALEH
jgi:hypothetical protein